jgi:VCBS repeat-containing protein
MDLNIVDAQLPVVDSGTISPGGANPAFPQLTQTSSGVSSASSTSGIFTVGESGWVYFDFLFDGGAYEGQLGFFSLSGLEMDSPQAAFEAEAIRRATGDNRRQGGIIIDDTLQGARYGGDFGPYESQNWDQGNYDEVTGFYLGAGTQFALVLMPQGDFAEGQGTPLFSIAEKNPGQEHQFADITGEDFLFGVEDLQVDKRSDKDYNDLVFSIGGAVSTGIAQFDTVADSQSDWRELPTIAPGKDYSFDPIEFLPTDPLTGAKYKSGELNVEIDPSDISIEQVIANTGAMGATRLFPTAAPSATGLENFWVLKFEPDADLVQKRDDLWQTEGIEMASFNELVVADAPRLDTFDDSEYSDTDDNFWGLQAIEASEAWDYQTGSRSVTVAVLDTGVAHTHPDLNDNIWSRVDDVSGNTYYGKAFINQSESNDPFEVDIQHGNLIAGIIGAEANGAGTIGVSPVVELLPIKVLDDLDITGLNFAPNFIPGQNAAESAYGWVSDVARGIEFAADPDRGGAQIINASFSVAIARKPPAINTPNYAKDKVENALRAPIAYAQSENVLFVTSSGQLWESDNGNATGRLYGEDIDGSGKYFYPSLFASEINGLDNIISVTATVKNGSTEEISRNSEGQVFVNYGENSVHLAAPGIGYGTISEPVGTAPAGIVTHDHRLAGDNLTSYAAAFTSGGAALLWAENPELTYDQVKFALMWSGDADESLGLRDRTVSERRLNIRKALEYGTLKDPDYEARKTKSGYTGDHFSVSVQPTATNIDGTRTYTPNGELPLDITLADLDGYVYAVTLTLSDPAAGNFVLAGDPSVGGETWLASGPVADVNQLLTQLRLDLADGYAEDFSIAVEIGDNISEPLTGTINFTVNERPIAVNDVNVFQTDEDTSYTFTVADLGLLGNDSDPDPGDVITFAGLDDAIRGTITDNGNGSYTYTPGDDFQSLDQGETDTDSFEYTIQDQDGWESEPAQVTFTINGVNDAPVAVDDNFKALAGQSRTLRVLANDIDREEDELQVFLASTTTAQGGSLSNVDEVITYTPADGFVGQDSFTYTVREKKDGGAFSTTDATVTIDVVTAFPAQFNLSDLDGSNGFVIKGIAAGDFSGVSVSSAGDMDDDGIDDLVIGAPSAAPKSKTVAGQSYVIFGNRNSFNDGLNLSDLDGEQGYIFNGINAGDFSGYDVSNAGDINGDGVDDVIIGTNFYLERDDSYAGESYVIFGHRLLFDIAIRQFLFEEIDDLEDIINGNFTGFSLRSNQNKLSGFSVSSVGDVNDDGIDDVIIGSPEAGHVVFGSRDGFGIPSALVFFEDSDSPDQLKNRVGFMSNGYFYEASSDLGEVVQVSEADFLSNEVDAYKYIKIPDLLASTMAIAAVDKVGTSYFEDPNPLDGTPTMPNEQKCSEGSGCTAAGFIEGLAEQVNWSEGEGLIPNDQELITIGLTSTSILDVDLLHDKVVNAFDEERFHAKNVDLDSLDGSNGFAINGGLGLQAFSNAGDINNDGIDDIIIGRTDFNDEIESYLVFGSRDGFDSNISSNSLNGSNGFVLRSNTDISGSYHSVGVSNAGDVNGDGIDDIIIGASRKTLDGQSQASSSYYIVFGSQDNFNHSLDLDSLDSRDGFVVNSTDASDDFGIAVSNAGDINSDGFDDLIIGVNDAQPDGKERAGRSYIVFGSPGGFSDRININSLDGINGFIVNGIDAFDESGAAVSNAGDVNGDGIDDLIIGAPGADPDGKSDAGETYVIFGVNPVNDAPTDIELSNPLIDSNTLGVTVGYLSVADVDDTTFSFALSDDRFEVVGNQLKLAEGISLDAVTEPTVTLEITVTDDGTPPESYTETFTLTVQDVSALPLISAGPTSDVEAMYRQLEAYLAAQDWQKADGQTWELFRQLGNKADGSYDYLNGSEIRDIHHKDIREIDRLWRLYSSDHFGYSVQLDIIRGNGFTATEFRDFGQAFIPVAQDLGWPTYSGTDSSQFDSQEAGAYNGDDITFDLSAPQGHLPLTGWRFQRARGTNILVRAEEIGL